MSEVVYGVIASMWATWLLLCVWVGSINRLLSFTSISFRVVDHPHWSEFFLMDLQFGTWKWDLTKVGHFAGFALLDILILRALRSDHAAVWLSLLFAVATEVLQIPLGRDGRLYDVGIDALGIACAWMYTRTARRGG